MPQGIGVIELAEHMPGEGGLYLWTKESYGDFHGFLCGWCYWMTNMFFVPSLLFYITGVTTYIVGGATAAKLNDSRFFFFFLTVSLLWITVFANVRGLGVGKWVNNIGGIGALTIGAALMIMGAVVVAEHRGLLHWKDLAPSGLGDSAALFVRRGLSGAGRNGARAHHGRRSSRSAPHHTAQRRAGADACAPCCTWAARSRC